MSCDICVPTARGYTVYFAEGENTGRLSAYFKHVSEGDWKSINERMFWVQESVLFDFLDYAEAHLVTDSIFAVLSHPDDPLRNLHQIRPLLSFKNEREASWIDELIANNSICTYYQPIVNVTEGKINVVGHELLSRGVDKQGGIIPPFKLFEAARIRNRVFALDRACRIQCVKNADVVKDKLIFINFIPTAIYVPEHCLSTTFEIIKEMGIRPEQVVFEVIETDEVKNLDHLKRILDYYRSHGFQYALDDVGTGFNNLEKLGEMEPNVVKLAIEFTNGVKESVEKQEVAKKVLQAAQDMNALALAEGVEREEDFEFLLEMGYDLFQGYYFGKPEPTPIQSIDKKIRVSTL